jgi:hypothetical protein
MSSSSQISQRGTGSTSVAIMQPYAFPYVGYFALAHASDSFVFFDDVHHRPRSWIHRNRILLRGTDHLFSIPLQQASQNRLINEIELHDPSVFQHRFLKLIEDAYRRAPYFEQGQAYVRRVFETSDGTIAGLARVSVQEACALLGIAPDFHCSSKLPDPARELTREQRLVAITRALGGSRYLNSPGGRALYGPQPFLEVGLSLAFVEPVLRPYVQNGASVFVPGLSIIDVLMNTSLSDARALVESYWLDEGSES